MGGTDDVNRGEGHLIELAWSRWNSSCDLVRNRRPTATGFTLVPSIILACSGTPADATEILINNGLAPPSTANVISDLSFSGDRVFIRNVDCGDPDPNGPCASPGTSTGVSVVEGGVIGFDLIADDSSHIMMTGGAVHFDLISRGESSIYLGGGTVGIDLRAFDTSSILMTAGDVGRDVFTEGEGHITLSGGSLVGDLEARETSTISILGTEFFVNGSPVGAGPLAIRSGTLTGVLASGETINNLFFHNSFDSVRTGTIELVLVPEPLSGQLIALGVAGLALARRSRGLRRGVLSESPMLRKSLFLVSCLASVLCLSGAARATTINTALGAGMDSAVQEDYPTATPGSSFELEVIRNPGAGSRAFLLRFDLTGWLQGSYSGSATIELTNFRDQNDAHTVNVYGIPDGGFGDLLPELDESTVTWSTAPGLVPDGALGDDEDVDPSNVLLGSFVDGAVEGAVDLISTGALLDFLNADTNGLVVFLLTTSSPDSHGQVYASKEATSFSYRPPGEFASGTHAPRLSFTASPVPEPATGALVVIGLLAVGLGRCRSMRH